MDLAMDWEDTCSYGVAQGYETVKVIGRGSFGKALLVRDRHGTQRVMKVVELQNASERRRQQAPMEAEMLQRLGPHPHIVRFHESFQEDFAFVIVMDFSRGGDLRQQVKSARSHHRSFPEPTVLQWLTQAFLGLKHIHGQNIIHRDLKSENLFLDGELQHLHIGDLGIACMLQAPAKVQLESSVVGTPYYLSPETCSMGIHSKASDLWAMGCVLYELTALKLPFYAPSLHELLQDIAKKRAPPLPSAYSNELAEAYAALMSQNRNKRPSCKEVLCMRPFLEVLRRLDWDSEDEEMVKVLTQAEEISKAAAQREPGTVAALRRVQELRRQAEASTPGGRPPLPGEEVTYAPDAAGIVETDVLQIDRPQTPRIPGDCQELLQKRPWSSRRPASAHRGKQKAKLTPLDAKPEATRVTCTVLDRRLTAARASALGAAEALRQAVAYSRKQSMKRQEARDASASASQSQVRSRALVRSESEPPMERG